MRLIGFCGLAGSGKSAAAQILIEHCGFERVRFAGPLKAMCRAIGISEQEIEGDLKEDPCDRLMGKTPRFFMQAIGTEFGRDLIHPDFWVHLWRRDAEVILTAGGRLVVDDVRFQNEAAVIRALGGKLIHIRREGFDVAKCAHASETQILEADSTIYNEGLDKSVLAARLAGALERLDHGG